MSRKYTPPKKKKKGIPQITRVQQASPAAPGAATASVTEFSMTRPPAAKPAVRTGAVPDTAADAIKYASLPRELRRIALYTLAAIVLIVILWLILR